MNNIVLTVMPHPDDDWLCKACWADGGDLVWSVPYHCLDLLPFMIARILLEQGYDLERLLVVRLRGADFEMMRAPLGAVAATPLVNTLKPVRYPQHAPRKGEALRRGKT
jgi:hypothetical protein